MHSAVATLRYRIKREDLPLAVLPLDEQAFPSDYRPTLENSIWWVVWSGREPVGYAGLRVCDRRQNKGLGFLSRAGVLREHRGHGLQRRLIRAREAEARALGLNELVTYVAMWNCASLNSLASCGYRFYRPATKWGGKESLYLRKRLQS
jgi:GNAT superfamily N-acetyltransferase